MAKKTTQGVVLTAMHKGAVIMVEHIHIPASARKTVYRLSSNNRLLRADLVQHLLESGLIQSNEDGLPGIGEAQTYSIKRNL